MSDPNSSDEVIGMKAVPKLKGVEVKQAAKFGAAVPASAPAASAPRVARNQSLAPLRRKPAFLPLPLPLPLPPPGGGGGGGGGGPGPPPTPVKEEGEGEVPALVVSEVEPEAEVEAEVKVKTDAPKKKQKGRIPLPADAPIMEPASFTTELKKRIVGTDPVKAKSAEYRPITSATFPDFMIQTYNQYSPYIMRVQREGKEAAAKPKEIDKDACKKRDPNKVETFYYQSLVRDYLSRGTPYRGLLVYHGLGTGKTCTSIAAAEALYWGGQRKIIVMTPATLSNNYRKDLGKCGYFPLRQNNLWAFLKLNAGREPTADPIYIWLTQALGLPPAIVTAQSGGWVPNPDKPSNWDELSADVKAAIRAQQLAHLNHRFEFIHYNGVSPAALARSAPVTDGKSIFDDAVIIIDEIHNLVRTINGTQIGGKPMSQTIATEEPREPTWSTPLGRERPGYRYPRGYTLYRLLQNAVGAKIVALSATPMINYSQELAILLNIIGGEQRAVELSLSSMGREPSATRRLEEWARARPDVDFYSIEEGDGGSPVLLLTPVPFGFSKVVREDYSSRGFVRLPYNKAGLVKDSKERNMEKWGASLAAELASNGLVPETKIVLHTYPMLPEDAKEFVSNFVDRNTLQIINANVLKARASGLISYYRGGSEELMPRTGRNEIVEVPMSEYMFAKYTAARLAEMEMDGEAAPDEAEDDGGKGKKQKGMTAAEVDIYTQATKSQQQGFLSFSRAACNWVFPEEVPRPKVSKKDQVKLLGAEQNKLVDADLHADFDADLENAPGGPVEVEAAGVEGDEVVIPDIEEPVEAPLSAALVGIIGTLMSGLEANAEEFLHASLDNFSPKYAAILANMRTSPGPVLVYSQFKTLEGLGIFAAVLRAAPEKYLPLDIQLGADGQWAIPDALMGANPRYILYTGDQKAEKRRLLLQLYNAELNVLPPRLAEQCRILLAGAPDNRDGRVCRAFMITQSGAEGISLANTRQVHIMEPYWNNVRLQQVIGRAIRLCSHMNLPWDDRVVDVFTYLSVFSAKQKAEGSKIIMMVDKAMTTDQIIFDIAKKKQTLADGLFEIAQTSAIDCTIHYHEHGAVTKCFKFAAGGRPMFIYHPDWRKDLQASVRAAGGGGGGGGGP